MDFIKVKLFFNTIIYLRPVQIYYRLYYYLRDRFIGYNVKKINPKKFNSINWEDLINFCDSYFEKKNSFYFLNISQDFSKKIDWNFNKNGKLWTYNLNYFDFLNQKNISKEIGLKLIYDFIENDNFIKDGKEPYPISLRSINWVKFLTKHKVKNELINQALFSQYSLLLKKLEYNLLGNHLLENGFSLLFGAYFFRDEKLYEKSKYILISELNEQILKDGAHFELSPMYHQIILFRLLDCIQLVTLNNSWKKNELISLFEQKASLMISWLSNITYKNGNIPMVNDSTYNIAPKSKELFNYARRLGINRKDISLLDSGYRKINNKNYQLLIDVGSVGPNYQPGHAHSDTFNFEFIKGKNPIFVDAGVSTYEKNKLRKTQRSTCSHNTVKIGSKNQTQVWGGFRVAKRARVISLLEKDNFIKATHDGYLRFGYKHERSFLWSSSKLIIKDYVSKSTNNSATAFFHLHSSISKPKIQSFKVMLKPLKIFIEFKDASKISINKYQLSEGFNKTKLAYLIKVSFDQTLKTTISF